jgi:hypothetical protein
MRNRGTFNALQQSIGDSAILVSPALGAVLLAVTNASTVIALDCLTFVVAAVLVGLLPKSQPGGVPTTTLISGAGAGVRFLWREGTLRTGAAALFASGAAVTMTQAILVVACAERFGGANHIGYCYSAVGLGGIAGGVLAIRWRHRAISRVDIFASGLAELVALGTLAAAHSLGLALALLFLNGTAGTLTWTFTTTYMQTRTPTEILGRVSAALTTANFVGMFAGATAALVLAPLLGWATALLVFEAGCAVALTATWARQPVRSSWNSERAIGDPPAEH